MTALPTESWLSGMVLPLAAVVIAAMLVPRLLALVLPTSLPAVVVNGVISAILLYVLGAAALVLARVATTPRVMALIESDPAGALRWAAGLGALPVILWLPILCFVELGVAQRVVRRE